jgi:F0F1-type ATP synthase assembly protein I
LEESRFAPCDSALFILLSIRLPSQKFKFIEVMSKPQEELAKAYRANDSFIGFGVQIAISFFLFVFGGYGLDVAFGTKPMFLIVGTLFTLIAIGTLIWKMLREADKKRQPPPTSNHSKT